MQRMREQLRSGSRAQKDRFTWEDEWRAAAAVEQLEAAPYSAERATRIAFGVVPMAALAALLPAIFPLTPGFSAADTFAAIVAAVVTAIVAVAAVPATSALGRRFARADPLLFTLALLSAGAAAIHFAVAKMHFDEYTLFGVFFVGAGIAQLVWSLWLLLRPARWLVVIGALGNGLIVALWGVDRIWGLPLGPEHWEPETVGFGDSVTAAFELMLVAGCLRLLARDRGRPLSVSAAATLTLAVAALTALSLLSVLGVGSSFLTPTA
jgi:hypothetical protein